MNSHAEQEKEKAVGLNGFHSQLIFLFSLLSGDNNKDKEVCYNVFALVITRGPGFPESPLSRTHYITGQAETATCSGELCQNFVKESVL